MAVTPSSQLPLGSDAPDFEIPDVVSGNTVRLSDLAGRPAVVVMFICNHCPYVIHVKAQLAAFGRDVGARNVGVVAISSNNVDSHPQDGPDAMRADALAQGYPFPYLYDESQSVAKAYRAACTPEFFVFDGDCKLVYRGQLDASRPTNDAPIDGADLRAAVDAILDGRPVATEQTPSIGCSIKWKPGNRPNY